MKKYKITNSIEKEIEAIDKDEAMMLFEEELAVTNECLENYTEIKEIKKQPKINKWDWKVDKNYITLFINEKIYRTWSINFLIDDIMKKYVYNEEHKNKERIKKFLNNNKK